MFNSIIGYTGFVGGNLINQNKFDLVYNSENISKIVGEAMDLLVVAAPSAVKWKANKEPEKDLKMIDDLIYYLKLVKVKQIVQISTVDVYKTPNNVDENTQIETENLHPYGKNRYYLENFIRSNFEKHLIVRLPGLFGKGLKKNFIYDLLNNNCLNMTHKDSFFQFYHLDNLWKDISIALVNGISLLNISSEPVSAKEVSEKVFNKKFDNITDNIPAKYDMKSIYFKLWRGKNGYLYNKNQILDSLRQFVLNKND